MASVTVSDQVSLANALLCEVLGNKQTDWGRRKVASVFQQQFVPSPFVIFEHQLDGANALGTRLARNAGNGFGLLLCFGEWAVRDEIAFALPNMMACAIVDQHFNGVSIELDMSWSLSGQKWVAWSGRGGLHGRHSSVCASEEGVKTCIVNCLVDNPPHASSQRGLLSSFGFGEGPKPAEEVGKQFTKRGSAFAKAKEGPLDAADVAVSKKGRE